MKEENLTLANKTTDWVSFKNKLENKIQRHVSLKTVEETDQVAEKCIIDVQEAI